MSPKSGTTSRASHTLASATKNLIQVRDEETGAVYHFACRTCINGHRAPSCNPAKHRGKILMRRPPPGRPANNCDHSKGANCGCNDRNLCTRLTEEQWDEVCEGKIATARMYRTLEELEARPIKIEPATPRAPSVSHVQQQTLAIRSVPPPQNDPQFGQYVAFTSSPATPWAPAMADPWANGMATNNMAETMVPSMANNNLAFTGQTYPPLWPGNIMPWAGLPGPDPSAQFPCPNCASTTCRCTACPPTMQSTDSGAWAKACGRRGHSDAPRPAFVRPQQMVPNGEHIQTAQMIPHGEPMITQPPQMISQPFQPDWETQQPAPQFEDLLNFSLPGTDQNFPSFDLSGTDQINWQDQF